ncbi:MAG: VUT family protein [Clostridia bacterium]|nr:VUT family protein [Clostridia bacterium]
MKQKIKNQFKEFTLLLKSVPSVFLSLFVLSVVAMNLLANKSINIPVEWLALDCGIIVSWVAFLTMDVLTKHFGPKASTQISVFALIINLITCLLLFIVSVIPGVWGESFVEGSENIINSALDNTFGGTWYVVLGSSVAFIASALINNFLNFAIGKAFKTKPDGFGAYVCRSYVSTAVAQFADNLIFALLVSHFFFGWTVTQCLTCAATGMIAELLCELLFASLGFKICKKWKSEQIGKSYFDFKNELMEARQ